MLTGLEAGLALVVLAVVLGLTVLTVLWLRRLPRNASLASETTATFSAPDSSPLSEAVLVVQVGGRVESINDLAREWLVASGRRPEQVFGDKNIDHRSDCFAGSGDLVNHALQFPGTSRPVVLVVFLRIVP